MTDKHKGTVDYRHSVAGESVPDLCSIGWRHIFGLFALLILLLGGMTYVLEIRKDRADVKVHEKVEGH